jgi:predicted dehydrogenase
MSTIRFGVVGVRNIGGRHLGWAREAPGCALTAIAERDPARLAAAADANGVAARHLEARELFARHDVDAVVLALPNHLHASMAIAALEAGKHVLVEKPLARSSAEAESMFAAARRAGRLLAVSMNVRFDAESRAAKAAMTAGAIGKPLAAETRWMMKRPFHGLWQRGSWFLDRELAGGGPSFDMGIHKLDLALHLLGFPAIERVASAYSFGIGRNEVAERGLRYELEDSATADIALSGGIPLRFEAGIFSARDDEVNETIVRGELGTLVVRGGAARIIAADGSERSLEAPGGGARSPLEHLARAIRGEERLEIGPEAALPEQRYFEAAHESARSGAPVSLLRAAGRAA